MTELEAEVSRLTRDLAEARMERDILKKPPRTLRRHSCPVRAHEDAASLLSAMTYGPTMEGWLYLAGVKDLYTCEVVGHAMDARMATDLVQDALLKAIDTKRPARGLIHYSDRGSHYCAQGYQATLRQFGMIPSMSRKGNCYDNAPMESFWGTLKNELVHHRRYQTREQARREIAEYIELFYNRRRHSRLGNRSPAAFALQWARQQPAA